MNRKLILIFLSTVLFFACTKTKELNSEVDLQNIVPYDFNNNENLYSEISGFYYCKKLDMRIWLYEDGTFVENNFWGWFSGCYQPDFFHSWKYPGKCAIRLMEKYPPIRDMETKSLRYVYQKNTKSQWIKDRFFVYDRDMTPLYIHHVYYDGMNGDRMKIDSMYKDTIPIDAIEICVSNSGEITSPNAPYKKGYNIVFFIRPNFNRTNLIWDKESGLKYESEDGSVFYFEKESLKGALLRVSPPIKESESYQNGDLLGSEVPDTSFPPR